MKTYQFTKKSLKALLAVSLFSFTVNSQAMDHSKMDHSKMDHSKTNSSKSGSRAKVSENTKKQLLKVFSANEKLHNSFFNYDGKEVEKNAASLKSEISAISDKKISKLLQFSVKKLDEVKASNKQDTNNQNYHLISMALIHILKTYDIGDKYNAYSCPMVKKKWIQNSKSKDKVHNPYASNMPHCGSKDTFY
jgi:hypothetical protein